MEGWLDGIVHCCFWHGIIMEIVRFRHGIHGRPLDGLEGKGNLGEGL
jgi:hypothetical protein